jgi:hypothetical protein
MVADLWVLGVWGMQCSYGIQQKHLGHSQLSQAERRKNLKKVFGVKILDGFFYYELDKEHERTHFYCL